MKVKTRRKKLIDIQELNAIQVAYGKPLEFKDYRRYVGFPAIFMAVFSFAITYFWWVALIMGALGALYGVKVILPNSVKRAYEMASLKERNRLLNNLTQILTDESKTTLKAINLAKLRADGELRDDIEILEAKLQGADRQQIIEAFQEINTKYERDVVFTQYFEQIETAIFEGRNQGDTLKQIKNYHNDTLKKTNLFLKIKEGHFRDLKQMLFIMAVFVGALTFSFGFDIYFNAFARTPIGWISGGIYFTIVLMLMKSFFKLYFDDSIMTVRRKK
jgi:hypothetical protein